MKDDMIAYVKSKEFLKRLELTNDHSKFQVVMLLYKINCISQ